MIDLVLTCAVGPRDVFEQPLQVPAGCHLEAAVQGSDLSQTFPELDWRTLTPSVWGRVVPWEQALQAGDRIELCRPLLVDPKVARRERFQQQGSRGAGLFARRRPGGKAGY